MTYASLDNLIARFGEAMIRDLTDHTGAGEIGQDVVSRALADTDAVIDASIGVRYRLPLAVVPALIADIALSIAAYKLHRYAPEQKVKDDYDQALKDLRELSVGTKKLDVAGNEPASSGAGGVVAIDRERPLTPEKLHGFI